MAILDELKTFTDRDRPRPSDYSQLLEYTSRLAGSLKWQRRFGSQLNKKNRNLKQRLKAYERLLAEEGVDLKNIKWRLKVD